MRELAIGRSLSARVSPYQYALTCRLLCSCDLLQEIKVGLYVYAAYKKSVRVSPVAHPTLRSSGIAFVVETSNAEAHACMNIHYKYIYHTHGRLCCFAVWLQVWELPDSEESRTKRQETPFRI